LSARLRSEGSIDDRREQLVRRGETAELVTAKRAQWAAVSAREFAADHDQQVESLGNRLYAADQIDRGPDDREVEAIGSANVAVDSGPGMQRHHDVQRRLTDRGKLVTKPAHRRQCFDGRLEGVARSLGVSARLFNRKDRQQAVTDEFQDLAAMVVWPWPARRRGR
jgi:hypothetical protein